MAVHNFPALERQGWGVVKVCLGYIFEGRKGWKERRDGRTEFSQTCNARFGKFLLGQRVQMYDGHV